MRYSLYMSVVCMFLHSTPMVQAVQNDGVIGDSDAPKMTSEDVTV
jgi:hypothetical protein